MQNNQRICCYTTDRPYQYVLPRKFASQIQMKQEFPETPNHSVQMTLEPLDRIILHKGIRTDGASPKFRIGKHFIGTWDGVRIDGMPQCLGAFTKHDLLGKHRGEHPFGYLERHWLMLWAIYQTIPGARRWLQKQPFSWRSLYKWPLVHSWYFLGPIYFIGVTLLNPIYDAIQKLTRE